jgi:hypothetical protein
MTVSLQHGHAVSPMPVRPSLLNLTPFWGWCCIAKFHLCLVLAHTARLPLPSVLCTYAFNLEWGLRNQWCCRWCWTLEPVVSCCLLAGPRPVHWDLLHLPLLSLVWGLDLDAAGASSPVLLPLFELWSSIAAGQPVADDLWYLGLVYFPFKF